MPKLLAIASINTPHVASVREMYYALSDAGLEVFCELHDRVALWGHERVSTLSEKLRHDCDGVLFLYCAAAARCPVVRITLAEAVARSVREERFVVVGVILDCTPYSEVPAAIEWLQLAPDKLAQELRVRLWISGERGAVPERQSFSDLREYVRGLLSGRDVWRVS